MQKSFPSHLIIRKKELDSTNNYALKLINTTNSTHGTVVLALSQTKGRGQRENYWESEYGKNLTISLILQPQFLPIHMQFGISKVISLGVCDFLSSFIEGVSIKWPNDIYVGDEKIAGILIEHSIMGDTLSHSICGIGLNVNQERFVSDAPNPTSMAIKSDSKYDLQECLDGLLNAIDLRYQQLEQGAEKLDKDYLSILYRGEGYHLFSDLSGQFKARIIGVAPIGQLILETLDGEQRIYNFKEVRFVI